MLLVTEASLGTRSPCPIAFLPSPQQGRGHDLHSYADEKVLEYSPEQERAHEPQKDEDSVVGLQINMKSEGSP